MKLIIGLGNPGKKYELTRHNIGFIILDYFASYYNSKITESKFDGLFLKTKIGEEDIILLKPQTFMNLSGECVIKYTKFFKISNEDILIIHDELDFNFGHIQFKNQGSSGGHNGLKNIFDLCHTQNLMRLRIGISKQLTNNKDWVLSNFSYQELEIIEKNKQHFVEVINNWINFSGSKELFNKYNNKDLNTWK